MKNLQEQLNEKTEKVKNLEEENIKLSKVKDCTSNNENLEREYKEKYNKELKELNEKYSKQQYDRNRNYKILEQKFDNIKRELITVLALIGVTELIYMIFINRNYINQLSKFLGGAVTKIKRLPEIEFFKNIAAKNIVLMYVVKFLPLIVLILVILFLVMYIKKIRKNYRGYRRITESQYIIEILTFIEFSFLFVVLINQILLKNLIVYFIFVSMIFIYYRSEVLAKE